MSNSVKDQFNTEFQKAKDEGSVRVDRIRHILREALSRTFAELKAGSSEIRSIVQDAVLTTMATPAKQPSTTAENPALVTPVVVEIEDAAEGMTEVSTSASDPSPVAESASLTMAMPVSPLPISEPYVNATMATPATAPVLEPATAESDSSARFSTVLAARLQAFKTRQLAQWQQDYVSLKDQVTELDQRLSQRYGNRYAAAKQTAKQQVAHAKDWYETTKLKAEASETDPVQQQQLEIDRKVAKLGVSAAQREQEIKQQVKQQVKQFVQTAVSKL